MKRKKTPLKMPPKVTRPRLVPRTKNDKTKIVRIGHRHLLFRDLYVNLLAMHWAPLLALITFIYLSSNLTFASVYYLNKGEVDNATSFADMFFFSVQTMSTIGYGKMTPLSTLANAMVTIEAFWGFAFFAFVTGLVFSKFSRPTAQVLFSEVAVISDFNGKPHLKIRLANKRHNRIVDAHANLYLLRDIKTKEGYSMRQFYDLCLVRDHTPLLALTWTLLHPIDEKSPLYGLTAEQLCEQGDEIILALSGVDETMSQDIHAHHSYVAEEIVYDAFFEDVLTRKEQHIEVNYNLFHSVHSAAEQAEKKLNGKR